MGAGTGVGAGAETGAGAGTGALGSRTALKILCKSSSEYLRILVAAEAVATGDFGPEDPADWSHNSLPDSGGREESEGAMEGVTEGATEGATEGRS